MISRTATVPCNDRTTNTSSELLFILCFVLAFLQMQFEHSAHIITYNLCCVWQKNIILALRKLVGMVIAVLLLHFWLDVPLCLRRSLSTRDRLQCATVYVFISFICLSVCFFSAVLISALLEFRSICLDHVGRYSPVFGLCSPFTRSQRIRRFVDVYMNVPL